MNSNRYSEGSFVLRVTLRPSQREVCFFVGQHLHTPMGLGQIAAIHPSKGIIQITLPYGIMYSSIFTIVGWGVVDASADETLCQQWSVSEKALKMPDCTHRGILELLKGAFKTTLLILKIILALNSFLLLSPQCHFSTISLWITKGLKMATKLYRIKTSFMVTVASMRTMKSALTMMGHSLILSSGSERLKIWGAPPPPPPPPFHARHDRLIIILHFFR